MHVLVASGQLDTAMAALRERLSVPAEGGHQLGLPQESWPQLETAVHESGDQNLIQTLEVFIYYIIFNCQVYKILLFSGS